MSKQFERHSTKDVKPVQTVSQQWCHVVTTSDLLITFLDWPAISSVRHNFLNAGSHVTPEALCRPARRL